MKGVILTLALTLVGCQQKIDQSVLTPDKVLLYDYEFEVQNRMSENGFSSAGLKVKCKAEIGNVVQDQKFLKVDCFEGLDYNGIYPWSNFVSSPKLTAVFQEHLKNLILTFQYRNGHVDDIMVPENVSEFALNVCKGILNLYENTIKNDQKTYNLKEKNRNFQGTRTYNYRMKDLKERNEKIILHATAQEIQQFTPFREETGETIIMEARQKLEFIEAHSRLPQIPSHLQKHGSLLYSFKDNPILPVPLSKIKNRNKEIEDGLHYLANDNVPKDGKRFLQLVNLLRTEKEINYSEVFDPFYSQPKYRAIVLDLISAAGTSMGLRYVRHKIVQQEITTTEAAQILLVFFHYSNAFEEVVEEAMAIMIDVLKGPRSLYRTTICLAYGSLLSRFYAISETIPDKYLKPLTDFATKAKRSSDIDASVLALKTFGNVRHIIVLKPIMKYLQTADPSDIRIQQNAIMALRNPGKKDPMRVQGILLPIIKNYKIDPLVRTCAAFVLLESKPTFPILMTLVNAMLHEPSIQVENFVFMYLSTIAGSRSPEFQVMASAYRTALKVLTEKSQKWAGYSVSRYSLIEYFDEFYKGRLGMNSMFLHEEMNTQPTFIMKNFKAIFMGSIFSPLEIGVQIQRIKDQVNKGHDSQQLQKTPSGQKITTDGSIALEVYAKIFDQEIVTEYIKMDRIRQILQANREKGHLLWIKYLIDVLKNLPNIHWQKYFMSAEIQRIVPTIKKDMILNMGIITPEIHALLEKKATFTAKIPINMDVAVNIKEKTFELELPPCKEETDIISLRLKTSAITSNIEEAPAAVSTPVFLPANLSRTIVKSFDRSSKKGDKRKDTLPSEKKSAENPNAQLEKYLESIHQTKCFDACTFGCKTCFHWADMHAGCIVRRSIYNFIGEYVFKISLKESDPNVPIEKLRFTIRGGARVAEQMVHLLRNEEKDLLIKRLKKELGGQELANIHFRESQIDQAKTPGGVLLPYVTVVLEAVRSDNKNQGYSVSLYEKHDYRKTYFKIVANNLNQTKWRACLDSLIQPIGFQYSLSWGHECKDYKIEVKLSEGQVAIYKAIQLKMKWTKLPFFRHEHYIGFMYLLPAVAYHLGFSTLYQKNPEREIIFRVIEKTPEIYVAIIKIPNRTFYNDDFDPEFLSSGIPSSYYQNPKLSRFNVALWLSRQVEANIEIWKTSNNVNVKAPEYGLESVTYDGMTLRIKTSPKIQGNTCGLCGNYNGEIKRETLIPNQAGTEQY
ncbi:hypothetical protein Chor_003537 [Crotalus horridus]